MSVIDLKDLNQVYFKLGSFDSILLFECLLFQGSVRFSVLGNRPETFDKLFKLDICVSLLLFFLHFNYD